MGVGTDQCIRIINVASFGVITLVDATGQIFHIDLMDNTETRRNDTECIESLHAPFHELVTFSVTVEFQLHVEVQRIVLTEIIDLDGVIHDQIDWNQRFDLFRILAGLDGNVSHGSEIDKQRNTGKVLQNHTGNDERNFI